MKVIKVAGATSEIWQIFIADSSSTTGAGLTGLLFNTAGLTCYYHRDTDTTATVMTLVTMTVGTFTSLGFKEIDATNMPGWYQLCPPNAALASGAKSCAFLLKGATNMAPLPIEVQLTAVNPDSATAFITSVATVTTVTNQLTAAQIATGVWQDATAGDFTTAASIGKSLYTTGNAPGAASGLALVGSNMGTVTTATNLTNLPSIPANWLTAAGIAASALNGKGDWMVTYTQPTGFLAATFPTGTIANTTNITGGTMTTVTNLTNAPTAGDFTATMKTSIGTAVAASAVASVTGNVGGNVVGSVGSVVAGVTVTTNNDKTGYALTSGERTSVADALLDRDMSVGTDSGSPTVRTTRQALFALRNKVDTTTLTVYKCDDTTASWTYTLTTDAAALPITKIDPA